MCGLAGVVGGGPGVVEAMLDRLQHRGPDERGSARGGRAHLGCVRLAIRGGAQGAQPLRTRRGLLVYNGEVFNTGELVKDLARHGVELDGQSDTAVVGALLDVYGIEAVDRLNGMFALAWDDGETVWLARDAAGIKPLYYRRGGDRFASEIRPLLDRGAALHGPALARWLTFHHAYGTETFFAGVLRVPPGGIVALPEGRVVRARHPALRFGAPNPGATAERLRRILARAVRDATPAERFGVALSGGVDSTLIASLRAGDAVAYHGRVAADGCDESAYARAAAAALGLPLVEIPITAAACRDALPAVVEALEEPVAGPGALAQWLVASRAARDVRILMSGCGGDELFGGYARAAALRHDAPPAGLESYGPLFARVRGLAGPERAFALLDRRDPALFTRDFLAAHPAPREAFRAEFGGDDADPAAAAHAELRITLPALLQVEDRVTMAFGLEGRVPLLDNRLLRTAMRLAPEARVGTNGRLKALLRDAAAQDLPEPVRSRNDKLGFPLPLGEWLTGPWRDFAHDLLLDARTRSRGMLDPAGVRAALALPGRYDRGLYSVLGLELWCRTFLDE
ncbi:MAG: asparagine synthase (glutamine-hydrolyzing) [Planctomycetota bacterium]|jgi:asparagine synthase (glutamine-hydrolysing)